MSIGERTPRSAANGNAHFAVAWTREIARTCEPCKQNAQFEGMMQRPGNTETRPKQALQPTRSNALASACARKTTQTDITSLERQPQPTGFAEIAT